MVPTGLNCPSPTTRNSGTQSLKGYYERTAFGLGPDDRHIATVDADGVALAAIQGLNQKLDDARRENSNLKERVENLERLLQKLVKE